jgi:hypothetical protein
MSHTAERRFGSSSCASTLLAKEPAKATALLWRGQVLLHGGLTVLRRVICAAHHLPFGVSECMGDASFGSAVASESTASGGRVIMHRASSAPRLQAIRSVQAAVGFLRVCCVRRRRAPPKARANAGR